MKRLRLAIGLIICMVAATACSGSTGPGASLGTFTVGVVFDAKPNAPGGGQLSFNQSGSTVLVTGSLAMPAMPNGTFTRFDQGTIVNGLVRFTVSGQSWQFEGSFTSDGRNVTGRHTMTSAGIISVGGWGGSKASGGLPVP